MTRLGTGRFALVLLAAVVIAGAVGLFAGASGITPRAALAALAGGGDPAARAIVRELRLPRIALGFLVGGVLAVSGEIGRASCRERVYVLV